MWINNFYGIYSNIGIYQIVKSNIVSDQEEINNINNNYEHVYSINSYELVDVYVNENENNFYLKHNDVFHYMENIVIKIDSEYNRYIDVLEGIDAYIKNNIEEHNDDIFVNDVIYYTIEPVDETRIEAIINDVNDLNTDKDASESYDYYYNGEEILSMNGSGNEGLKTFTFYTDNALYIMERENIEVIEGIDMEVVLRTYSNYFKAYVTVSNKIEMPVVVAED